MGRTYDDIPEHLHSWMEEQPIWFVASAPLSADGHVNLSPKGDDSFRVIDATTVAYLDRTGSGVETIAHIRENGRLTIMFCSFGEKPNIVRLHGTGSYVVPGDARWEELAGRFPPRSGARAVIVLAVHRVTTACGYGVPMMDLVGGRGSMDEWADRQGPDGVLAYRAEKNQVSVDGLPALAP